MADWEKHIAAALQKFTRYFKERDFAAFSNLYTEDCVLMAPGAAIQRGRSGPLAAFPKLAEAGAVAVTFTTEEVFPAGDTATERGHLVTYREDGTVFSSDKYVVIWRRVGLEIQMYTDIWNSNL